MTTFEQLFGFPIEAKTESKTLEQRLNVIRDLASLIQTYQSLGVTDLETWAAQLEDEATQVLFYIQDLLKQKQKEYEL